MTQRVEYLSVTGDAMKRLQSLANQCERSLKGVSLEDSLYSSMLYVGVSEAFHSVCAGSGLVT